jgi:hypothetical protein
MQLNGWVQRSTESGGILFHLLAPVPRSGATGWKNLLYLGDNIHVSLVNQPAALIFSDVKRIAVAGDCGLRPSPKSLVTKARDSRGAFRAMEKSAIDRNRLLHGSPCVVI